MTAQAQKVGAGDTAPGWPDGLVSCGECAHAQESMRAARSAVGRSVRFIAVRCDVFELAQAASEGRYCTAFRPIGWGAE
jgi:hypothetical protein